MKFLRILLFPFSILYGCITSIRNWMFDRQFLQSKYYNLPIIAVGNLSVGGTGKTPQIEYLIRLLAEGNQLATLSRGYKRKSEGFVLADENANAAILGDEPFQFFTKFKGIQVAVDANRANGIEQLLSQKNKPDVILLDDAYQHRKVKAGFYVLLTAYGDLYADDCMLPTGNLRETKAGANRANIIVVTKCSPDISLEEQNRIKQKLKLQPKQELFFTFIDYDTNVYSQNEVLDVASIKNEKKLLLAGIAKPDSFFTFLKSAQDDCLVFPDHHFFSETDIQIIQEKAKGLKIITTEKDYVRLMDTVLAPQLYYLPIQSSFVRNQNKFDEIIQNYVGESTRNRSVFTK
ncbi:tetraacyldisaccharide 4'-kinase [Flavobacterium agrisoli]|uniref:Tetraacyldisaccharide 4'-kinase n=1 Tax=Flavobacterium agrisoli TaxID=2793066 RepID=A0A934UKU7_9FLAO|nr:tetraacyldisaccharide 4'-kinase [Flavobacterium agrisoli]MBK0370815.1 tetraacyldisaccharide 4'-kinase [Flavobacterium agrisoli]